MLKLRSFSLCTVKDICVETTFIQFVYREGYVLKLRSFSLCTVKDMC